jgi:hypothetical protein
MTMMKLRLVLVFAVLALVQELGLAQTSRAKKLGMQRHIQSHTRFDTYTVEGDSVYFLGELGGIVAYNVQDRGWRQQTDTVLGIPSEFNQGLQGRYASISKKGRLCWGADYRNVFGRL